MLLFRQIAFVTYVILLHLIKLSVKKKKVTHAPLDLVLNGFNDTSVFTLTQSLCRFEVLKGRLHFLLFKGHHGVLKKTHPG